MTRVRTKTPKAAAYPIDDNDWYSGPHVIGMIRCPDDDRATYDRLLLDLLNLLGMTAAGINHADPEWGADITLQEPTWQWLRINPDPSGDHAWLFALADGPGRGNFRGVLVTAVDESTRPVSPSLANTEGANTCS
jgi:hypothetical protein